MKNIVFVLVLVATSMVAQRKSTCHGPNAGDLNYVSKCSIKPESKGEFINEDRDIAVRSTSRVKRFSVKRANTSVLAKKNSEILTSVSKSVAGKNVEEKKSTRKFGSFSKHIKLVKKENKKEVKEVFTFEDVDILPLFDGQDSKNKQKDLVSFEKKIKKHVRKNFSYPKTAKVQNIQGDVWVEFTIDTNGNVTDVVAKSQNDAKILERQAKNIISKLEKFTPAMKAGKNVNVSYALPISFSL